MNIGLQTPISLDCTMNPESSAMANILIVDDDGPIRELLGQILKRKGYLCKPAADAAQAREILTGDNFDLILCDINMPGEKGLDFMRYVLSEFPETVGVMLTGVDDPLVAEASLDIGVYDYLTKPFDCNSVLISVSNALRRREVEISNRSYSKSLEQMVSERTNALEESMKKLRKTLMGTIQATALTVEMRDPYTAGHQRRVAELARDIAMEMSLSERQVEGISMGGVIHDLGKIAVPAEILSKPGRLNKHEFDFIKEHPKVGYEIIKGIEFPWPIDQMALQHHERYDGSGYPQGLVGEEIRLEARIIGVADVVEAMASHRPYRPGLGIDKALEEIEQNRGKLYDPDVVDACLRLFRRDGYRLAE